MALYAGADRIRPELQVRPGLVAFFESDLRVTASARIAACSESSASRCSMPPRPALA